MIQVTTKTTKKGPIYILDVILASDDWTVKIEVAQSMW